MIIAQYFRRRYSFFVQKTFPLINLRCLNIRLKLMKFFILSFFIWMTVARGETTPPFFHVIVSESPPYAYEESPNNW